MNTKKPPIDVSGKPTILLQSGTYFDFTRPDASTFDIVDIAHGLSNICRFGGQCQAFYSVAQHSVYVSHLVTLENRFAALMHDAAEAFLGDIPRPLKRLLPDYRALEDLTERAIATRFRFRWPMDPEIKEADKAMLAAEQLQLMRNRDGWSDTKGVQAAGIDIIPWDPPEAKRQFLARFSFLCTEERDRG